MWSCFEFLLGIYNPRCCCVFSFPLTSLGCGMGIGVYVFACFYFFFRNSSILSLMQLIFWTVFLAWSLSPSQTMRIFFLLAINGTIIFWEQALGPQSITVAHYCQRLTTSSSLSSPCFKILQLLDSIFLIINLLQLKKPEKTCVQ